MKSSQINVIIIITQLKNKELRNLISRGCIIHYYLQHYNLYENEQALGEGTNSRAPVEGRIKHDDYTTTTTACHMNGTSSCNQL